MKRKLILLTLSMITIASIANSQTFEIRTVNKGFGTVGVEMRATSGPAPTTANNITDLVFGIKWSNSYNVDLAAVASTAYNIKKSGSRLVNDTFNYQAFYADFTPFLFPENWSINDWVEIMTIPNTLNGTVDTGAFSICEPGFDVTTNPNIGVDLTDFTPVLNGKAAGVLLPVHLLNFDVYAAKENIIVNWNTVNEIDNKGFEILRSNGNPNNFVKIGWIDSKITKQENKYEFLDSNVIPGIKYFYRLKQIDKDFNSAFSAIKIGEVKASNQIIIIRPNPVKSFFYISNFRSSSANSSISIYSMSGVALRSVTVANDQQMKVDINTVPSGVYIVKVSDGKNTQWGKVMKE